MESHVEVHDVFQFNLFIPGPYLISLSRPHLKYRGNQGVGHDHGDNEPPPFRQTVQHGEYVQCTHRLAVGMVLPARTAAFDLRSCVRCRFRSKTLQQRYEISFHGFTVNYGPTHPRS